MRIASRLFSTAGLGGEELGHAGLHVAALALSYAARGALDEEARGLERVAMSASFSWIAWCSQIGLPKVLRICGTHGIVERRLRDADAARRDVDAAQLEPAQRVLRTPCPRRRRSIGRPGSGSRSKTSSAESTPL